MNLIRKPIVPTIKQTEYIESISSQKKIIVATGPAGCGKTLFACQEAAKGFRNGDYNRIIVTRPTVAVDEDIGYLPGGIDDKLGPWIHPMMDMLGMYFSFGELDRMKTRGTLEIAPLSFMRGRTFDDSFIIADEMQNCTINQMKMILTRIGFDSKMVVTGDTEQSDLKDEMSGLVDFLERLKLYETKYIDEINLSDVDIKRHPVVNEIIELYNV